jgi:hypothetical protein
MQITELWMAPLEEVLKLRELWWNIFITKISGYKFKVVEITKLWICTHKNSSYDILYGFYSNDPPPPPQCLLSPEWAIKNRGSRDHFVVTSVAVQL